MTDLEQQQREQRRQKIQQLKNRRILAYSILAVLIFLTVFLLAKVIGLFAGNNTPTPNGDAGGDPPAAAGDPAVYPAWPLEYTTIAQPLPPYDFEKPVPLSAEAAGSYFSNVLFIGDSRIEGLALYGAAPGADFACSGSISVTNAFALSYSYGGETFTLQDKLGGAKSYTAIYLMFGLNELGWPYSDVFYSGYGDMIDSIKALQPDAVIYIQSVFPVTAAASAASSYINNQSIAALNAELLALAAQKEVCYLDVYGEYADSGGALPDSYAEYDGVALAIDFYPTWAQYLKTHIVSKEILP